jgi:hypothetical protein
MLLLLALTCLQSEVIGQKSDVLSDALANRRRVLMSEGKNEEKQVERPGELQYVITTGTKS